MSYDEENTVKEKEPLREKVVTKSEYNNKTFYQKLCYLKSNITVEPIMAGLVIASTLSRLAIQNLNLDKACRVELQYEKSICDALLARKGNLTGYEEKVQKVISSIEAWRSIISTSLPILVVTLVGAWSDRTGNRKICILLPVCGEFLISIGNIASTYFFYEIPIQVTMLLEVIFPAVTGGWVLLFVGVFSYISDITNDENRTSRVGIVNLCLTAGIPIGTALSGILLRELGFYGVFTLSGVVVTFTFCYGYLYLDNNTKPGMDEVKEVKPLKIYDVVNLVKETAVVAFKKRDSGRRKKILLTLLVVAIVYGPNHGERIVIYLYVRYRLKWDAVRYSIYSTYSIIINSIGALFMITVLSRRLGFHDSLLCLISVASKFGGSVLTAFVRTDFDMFMVPIMEILNALTFTSLRSMSTKLVDHEETGKINSLLSLVETLAAMLFDPVYSAMYLVTLQKMPGAVFLFSSAMTLPACAILIYFFVQHRKELRQKRKEDKNQIKMRETVTFTFTEETAKLE